LRVTFYSEFIAKSKINSLFFQDFNPHKTAFKKMRRYGVSKYYAWNISLAPIGFLKGE
jgi:hypothetical protein